MTAARPDTWMPGRWHSFNPLRPWAMPDGAGVYVIFFDGVPAYVGQSNNLRGRLGRHAFKYGYARTITTPWGEFPDTLVITGKIKISKRFGDWAMWELRLIKRLQPRFNSMFVGQRRGRAVA